MNSRFAIPVAVLFAISVELAGAVVGHADAFFDATGFQPNRAYFSQLPYEHIDPLSGNLILTFTDLSLPGPAGLDLRIQRTYNSHFWSSYGGVNQNIEDTWAGIGWTLHMGRVLDGPTIEM